MARSHSTINLVAALAALALHGNACAQEQSADAAQANNPLANFTAVNLQNYYIGELTSPEEDGNQFWVRYAQPISLGNTNWIFRASLPVNSSDIRTRHASASEMGTSW